jgi:hypothetical protein
MWQSYPVLIGSRAAAHWCRDFRPVDDSDYDLILREVHLSTWTTQKVDVDHYDKATGDCTVLDGKLELTVLGNKSTSSNAKIYAWCHSRDTLTLRWIPCRQQPEEEGKQQECRLVLVCPLELLEMIKQSHIYHPIQWEKHVEDLHHIRKTCLVTGHGIPAKELSAILEQRREETNKRHCDGKDPAADIKLGMSNDEFLQGGQHLAIKAVFVHDDVHEAVKIFDKPMYTLLKTDPSKAMCSPQLFQQLSLDKQLANMQEEAMVLALERELVPGLLDSSDEAYKKGLRRIGTTLFRGIWRDFVIGHYPELKKCPKDLVAIQKQLLAKATPLPVKKEQETIVVAEKKETKQEGGNGKGCDESKTEQNFWKLFVSAEMTESYAESDSDDDGFKKHVKYKCTLDLLGQGYLVFSIRKFPSHYTGDCNGSINWTLLMDITHHREDESVREIGTLELSWGVGEGYSNNKKLILDVHHRFNNVSELPSEFHGKKYSANFLLFAWSHIALSKLSMAFDSDGSYYMNSILTTKKKKVLHEWIIKREFCQDVKTLYAYSGLHGMVWLWLYGLHDQRMYKSLV